MTELFQALWSQMRAELRVDALPQLDWACRSLLSENLGSLTEPQVEDVESMERAVSKLTGRIEGEPIDWSDYTEAAHALRGPLNTTLGFSRLMLKGAEGPLNEAQREALETTYTISRRLLALFNLLLDALLLTGKALSFTIEPVRAQEILQELTVIGNTLATNREFTFETEVKPCDTALTIRCDAKRLKQALSALLAVLVKYRGGGTVTLRAWPKEEELWIQLENRTCQLPAPLLTNLFSLLTDEADRSLPYDAHLRLGLATHLLAGMSGRLEAHQKDETCSFTITLPLG